MAKTPRVGSATPKLEHPTKKTSGGFSREARLDTNVFKDVGLYAAAPFIVDM